MHCAYLSDISVMVVKIKSLIFSSEKQILFCLLAKNTLTFPENSFDFSCHIGVKET
jgi:hypothetical protein